MTNNCRKLCIQRNWDNDDFDLYVVFSTKKKNEKENKRSKKSNLSHLFNPWLDVKL